MISVGIRKYSFQSAQTRVLKILKQYKGIPLTVEEISFKTNLDECIVRDVIHYIQQHSDLCIKNKKVYFPESNMTWWLAAFGLVVICTFVFCEVANHM